VAKLLVTLGFTVTVASFPSAAVVPLIPLLLYPVLCAVVGGIPAGLLARRIAAVLPFALLLGAANPFVDRVPLVVLGTMVITRGFMSFVAIAVRTLLVVAAALSLTALSGFDGICQALERLRLPHFAVLQLRLMFRHLSTLSDEVGRALLAYRLRSGRDRGVAPDAWGGVAGGVLLRSMDRADRIQRAMLCRGGPHRYSPPALLFSRSSDWLFLGFWWGWFALCRLVDLPSLAGALALGGPRG
jgi:cobalt/nickel transport system permease protein